ncbi:MAG: hypothetical protein K8R39_10170 [Arcobacteraceae bacterium]|nr:hypothetical protein [Arcobacteraceae bacterium]
MKKLYGSLIFFFYFVKYPIVIFLPVAYWVLDYPNSVVMDILFIISFILILKDIVYPYKKE